MAVEAQEGTIMGQYGSRSARNQAAYRAALVAIGAGCHVCGKAIDYTVRSPDPESFVADHVVPLASARSREEFAALDQMSNIRPAHRTCNNQKSDREFANIVKNSGSLRKPSE